MDERFENNPLVLLGLAEFNHADLIFDLALDPARPIRYVRGNNLTNSGPEHLFINITPRTA